MKKRPLKERFNEKWEAVTETGCWLWIGNTHKSGYGRIEVDGRTRAAQQIAYELYRGPIPIGLELDHLCRVRCCVNPWHLEPVTRRVNIQRGIAGLHGNHNLHQSRKTHCPSGHEYTKENTYRHRGYRYCKACHRASEKRRYAKASCQHLT